MNDLIHVNEALSGLPVDVDYISFEDLKTIDISRYNVIINAGIGGSAWSGGECWNDPSFEEIISRFVYNGGTFIGINEPSLISGYNSLRYFIVHSLK